MFSTVGQPPSGKSAHAAVRPARESAVEQLAQRHLRQSGYRSIGNLHCAFHEGELTLRGRLPSYYLKQLAQTVVANVQDVQIVRNRVEVVDPD